MFSAAIKSGAAGNPTDPKFPYVTMLLHGDGTNGAQNNTFLDSSTNNFTITRNGNTTQGTFTPYGSNWSNYFDGNGDYLSTASNSALAVGTGAFTAEAWIYPNTINNYAQIIGQTVNSNSYWMFCLQSNGAIRQQNYTVVQISSPSGAIVVGQWQHVVLVRDASSNIAIFVNGTRVASGTDSTNWQTNSVNTIGASTPDAGYHNGYISNARLVKGSAVYDPTLSTLTVPTTPLTAVTNTSLLTCQSNRFIDNSTNNFTLTRNGDVSVQRFSPFAPTNAYSTATIGGSGYFDGSGDYLTLANNAAFNLGANNFTIEAWVYVTATPGGSGAVIVGKNSATYPGGYEFNFAVDTGRTIFFGAYTTTLVSLQGAIVTSLNAWNHVAAVRSGSNWALFVNGVRDVTATSSGTVQTTSSSVYVGDYGGGGRNLTGYSSNIRLVNGSAVYDPTVSTLTVPTAPLTAITNTSLLLSYTNAGILDNAMMNDLETRGNAQISTSVKKYGTGSISFDGTDDRLTSSSSPNIAFGTGDFTVEAWIYPNVLTGERGFIQTSDTVGGLKTSFTTGVVINIDVSPYRLSCNIGGTNVNSGSTYISATTWTHVAITRASGSVRMFINGTLVGGPTTVTADLTGQNIVIGGYYSTTYLWNGYVDDLRITKGFARYTSNFTAPTAAFPNN